MRIAIPLSGGCVSMHFAQSDRFALVDVDQAQGKTVKTTFVTPSSYEPGEIPSWLREQGADAIITGVMGRLAQRLFAENGIRVVVGAAPDTAETVVAAYLSGSLIVEESPCGD
jgi:predicted Fe-Mo cluster-binding NifX family protein